MTKLQWNSVGDRRYETGIDRGVLYIPKDEVAVPWNGLIAVDVVSDTTVEPLYFNGVKYFDYVSRGDFKGSLKAYTYPEEFEIFDGVLESPNNGIFITGQIPKSSFHLSYRTYIGDDVNGLTGGYKIHVLYNLTAKPSNRSYTTLNADPSAFEFVWELSSVPVEAFNLRPTSHIIFDTTKMHEGAIYEVERVLYGTDETNPKVLTVDEFETLASMAPDIAVTDNGDGTWTAVGSDYYLKLNSAGGEFRIEQIEATYLNPTTYEISAETDF